MKCKEVQENLSLYLDHELSAEERVLLRNHLVNCSICQGELAALQETISQLSSLEEVNPPASFRRELYTKLEKSIAQETVRKKKGFWGGGLMTSFKTWKHRTVFLPVAISLVLLVLLVPVFLDEVRFDDSSKLTEKSSEPEMMFYGVSMDQNSVSQENVAKSMAPEMAAVNLGRGVAPEIMTTTTTGNVVKQSVEESKSAIKPMERKLIKNAEIHLLADDYNSAVESLKSKVSALDGYITNETVNVIDSRGSKRGYLEVRVPQLRFDEFFAGVNNLGKLKNSNIYTQDVTEEYIDVESRLNVMRTKEERLLAILNQSGELSDVLAVENELANTRAQLESLEGRLRYLSNQTEFSTFNLTIEQVVVSTQQVSASGLQGVGVRAKEAFVKAINNIVLGIGLTLVFISAAIPYLVVVAVVVGLIWRIWRSMQRRKKQG
ncbi:MAG: DUF4349 domain-containing protein [Peptococcia bacterium]|jgi:hypothetical protein